MKNYLLGKGVTERKIIHKQLIKRSNIEKCFQVISIFYVDETKHFDQMTAFHQYHKTFP